MTDRVQGFTVTLERDIRDDDFERILEAVQMIKGVGHVEPSITTSEDHYARIRVLGDVQTKLFEFARELGK